MAFRHVPAHLQVAIRAHREWPPLRGQFVSSWSLPCSPLGMAMARDDTVLVSDWQRDCVYVYTLAGVLVRQWGSSGVGEGQFNGPRGLAVTKEGNVVVVDSNNHRVQVFRADGTFVRMWGSRGAGDGEFLHPQAVTVTMSGQVVVTDSGDRVQVFRLSDGAFLHQWERGTIKGTMSPGVLSTTPDGQVCVCVHHA